MSPLDLVRVSVLMERTQGRPEIAIALIDGPVALDHRDLAGATVRALPGRELPGKLNGACSLADSVACTHETFVAGMLSARRGSSAPAICPGCTLLLRPIFAEALNGNGQMPSATPEELAEDIIDSAEAFARNESSAAVDVQRSSLSGARKVFDVIFAFTNRTTDVVLKQFGRVDVTEEFPFLLTKLSPYCDR